MWGKSKIEYKKGEIDLTLLQINNITTQRVEKKRMNLRNFGKQYLGLMPQAQEKNNGTKYYNLVIKCISHKGMG